LPLFPLPFDLWLGLVVIAYYTGHVVQGLGNVLLDNDSAFRAKLNSIRGKSKQSEVSSGDPELLPVIQNAAALKAKKLMGIPPSDELPVRWVRDLADELVIQWGVSTEREVYLYREGFYRGSAISLLVFALCLLIRAIRGVTVINFCGQNHTVEMSELLVVIALCLIASFIFNARFNRFGKHHRKEAILCLLLLDGRQGKPKSVPDAVTD